MKPKGSHKDKCTCNGCATKKFNMLFSMIQQVVAKVDALGHAQEDADKDLEELRDKLIKSGVLVEPVKGE